MNRWAYLENIATIAAAVVTCCALLAYGQSWAWSLLWALNLNSSARDTP